MVSSVALIGNALSLFERKYGPEIDSHENIARINRAAILFTKHFEYLSHGSRTDIWFVWRLKEYETVKVKRPNTVMQMAYWEPSEDESVQIYPETLYKQLEQRLGAVPSTGLMALDLLSNSTVEKISIYGFDWKESPTFTDTSREVDFKLNSAGSLHNFSLEREYCKDMFFTDSRFIFRF